MRGTRVVVISSIQGNHLASCGIPGDPDPRLVGLLLHKAGHGIRFHLQATQHDVAVTGDGLDGAMLRQCLDALEEDTS